MADLPDVDGTGDHGASGSDPGEESTDEEDREVGSEGDGGAAEEEEERVDHHGGPTAYGLDEEAGGDAAQYGTGGHDTGCRGEIGVIVRHVLALTLELTFGSFSMTFGGNY